MLHCNGIDLFVTLMGNFSWGPISCNDIISNEDNLISYLYQMVLISLWLPTCRLAQTIMAATQNETLAKEMQACHACLLVSHLLGFVYVLFSFL